MTDTTRQADADRELTKWAAKAAGLWDAENNCVDIPWLPLVNDGDAFRLAVALRIDIFAGNDKVEAFSMRNGIWAHEEEKHGSDPYAATRRAIVRAAAEIGRSQHG